MEVKKMKFSKKILAILLSTVMAFSVLTIAFSASAKDDVVPVIFIPGIGQSQTYMYDDQGNVVADWNMLHLNTDFKNYSLSDWIKATKFIGSFIASVGAQKDLISKDTINGLLEVLFADHMRDENGKFVKNIVTPNYPCPISGYNEDARSIFDRRIPCQGLVDEIGADNVYCFNYSIFSNTSDNANGLNDYIENVVIPQTGAKKVILVPMSMGATVANAYIDMYPDSGRIDKVVSVVGAWNGSDVFADLMLAKFDENAPSLVYTDAINQLGLVDTYVGYIINIAARILPKQELDNFLYDAVDGFVKTLILDNTALISLCPYQRYDEFAQKYLTSSDMAVKKAETDRYALAQKNVKERLEYQRDTYGTEFYFICGYNLGFGDVDYGVFHFFDSYDETNSDEVIQISSTAPGTSFVKAGTSFDEAYKADPSHHLSPDGSIDTSTCYFEKTTWYFSGQKHELTDNNTALDLAFQIVQNKIKSIDDCKDTYPQFNQSRDVRKLRRDYIPDAEKIDTSKIDSALATELTTNLDAAKAMVARTINNRTEDDKIIQALYDTLVKINGVYNFYPDKYQPKKTDTTMEIVTTVLGVASKVIGAIFGEKGYADFWYSLFA
jgi:pimeloyl-ACP methyl ester carboxylesterase